MRKIVFRGYNQEAGWVYGSLLTDPCSVEILNHDNDGIPISVNPSTVGQFTGLTDKNGTEIYEGDIVEVCRFDYNGNDHHYKVVCEWGVAEFILVATHRVYYEWKGENLCRTERKIKDNDCDKPIISLSEWAVLDKKDLEVIGNIHDNPIEE